MKLRCVVFGHLWYSRCTADRAAATELDMRLAVFCTRCRLTAKEAATRWNDGVKPGLLSRFRCWLRGGCSWVVLQVNAGRSWSMASWSPRAGCLAWCHRCGASWDDLSGSPPDQI